MLLLIIIFLEQVLVVVVSTARTLRGIIFEEVVISYILRFSDCKVQKHLSLLREMLPHV